EVLEAAGTKWNFLHFRPGLVGGHCIGVDPYYLTHKADLLGYHPQVILAGRRINDGMGKYIADETVKLLIRASVPVKGSHIIVLGLTFKENCPDLRNSRVIDVVRELESFDAIVAAVSHREYRTHSLDDVAAKLTTNGLYVDVKCQADAAALRARGIAVW